MTSENKISLASSFDDDASDTEPPDGPTMERRPTVVLAAPSSSWDNDVREAPLPRKKSRKFIVSTDDDDDKHISERGNDDKGQNSYKSDWSNTRTHQNFLVDSIEIERKVKGDADIGHGSNFKSDTISNDNSQHPSQQLSPYLSLPKQPPTMSLVQEGEFLFQEIDRDGDGVVSKIDIIKALRVNSPLAKVFYFFSIEFIGLYFPCIFFITET